MLDQFEEATLVGARIASSKMGFFYDDINDENAQPYSGADTDEAPALIDPETGRSYDEENFIDIEAGQFEDCRKDGIERSCPRGYHIHRLLSGPG